MEREKGERGKGKRKKGESASKKEARGTENFFFPTRRKERKSLFERKKKAKKAPQIHQCIRSSS